MKRAGARDLAVKTTSGCDAEKMKSEQERTSVNTLYTATAVIELGAGFALLCFPSATVVLLVGAPLETPAALTVARVGGAGLLALGVACWLARDDTQSPAAWGLVAAMGLYNLSAVVVLGAAGIRLQPVGVVLWPAVALHAVMMGWCIAGLLKWKIQNGN
jgi:hypothetical protein